MWQLIPNFPREIGTPNRYFIKDKKQFLNIINKYNGYKKLFYAIYKCNNKRKYDRCYIDKIYFDFDEKDSHEDTVKLHEWCVKKKYKHLLIFSGGGYHIYVFTKNGEKIKQPKKTLWHCHHTICKELKLKLDKHVKGDVSQLDRVPNTYNPRRRRYCIPITKEDLKQGHEFIREKAKKQSFKFVYYGERLLDLTQYENFKETDDVNYKFATVNHKLKKEIEEDKLLKKLPTCISYRLKLKFPGYRDRFLVIIYLRDKGYMLSETIEILRKFLNNGREHGGRIMTDFEHCVHQEMQPQRIYNRPELFFPNCNQLKVEGKCFKNCEFENKLYL